MRIDLNSIKEYQTVVITYRSGGEVVSRKAFYSKSDGYYNARDEWIETPNGFFSVPQYWRNFMWMDGSVSLMPEGFNTYGRVVPDKVIKLQTL